jgi:hypothetical protein
VGSTRDVFTEGDNNRDNNESALAREKAMTSAVSSHEAALSLLFNLGSARQERSMLFSDEQKLLFKGWKKGFVKNTKLDFMIN